jgi:signal peptidase I
MENFSEQIENKNQKKFLSPFSSFIFDLIKLVVLAFIIVWPIHRFVFQPFYVSGPSMESNFYNNDYLIIEKITYYFRQPLRGEVIIFQSPINSKDHLIKRVIGLPGEKIAIEKGQIIIYNHQFPQGIILKEEYLTPGTGTPGQTTIELKEDEYYVLGDNRNMSLDSRSFGTIKEKNITGRAWFRGLPTRNAGLIKTPIFIY